LGKDAFWAIQKPFLQKIFTEESRFRALLLNEYNFKNRKLLLYNFLTSLNLIDRKIEEVVLNLEVIISYQLNN